MCIHPSGCPSALIQSCGQKPPTLGGYLLAVFVGEGLQRVKPELVTVTFARAMIRKWLPHP